jgi:hypothetical protein
LALLVHAESVAAEPCGDDAQRQPLLCEARARGAAVCAWLPTGRDIEGRRPAREIAAHSSALVQSPRDL